MTSEPLTIGVLARRAGVNVQTVRYYERRGLLAPARRTEAGYRLYGPDAARVLLFIRNAQGLGFTLAEIAGLLRLRVGRASQCAKVKRRATQRLETVRVKIAALRAMERALARLVRTCSRDGRTGACPILESLEGGEDER